VLQVLLVGLFMDPRVYDLLSLGLKGSNFLLGKLDVIVVASHHRVCRAHRARFANVAPLILPISKSGGGIGVLGLLAGRLSLINYAFPGRSGFSYSKRFHLFPNQPNLLTT
jgi:hypothetical protein